MNRIWAIFFKDRIKTPFSAYKMSLAELIFLLSLFIFPLFILSEELRGILNF